MLGFYDFQNPAVWTMGKLWLSDPEAVQAYSTLFLSSCPSTSSLAGGYISLVRAQCISQLPYLPLPCASLQCGPSPGS